MALTCSNSKLYNGVIFSKLLRICESTMCSRITTWRLVEELLFLLIQIGLYIEVHDVVLSFLKLYSQSGKFVVGVSVELCKMMFLTSSLCWCFTSSMQRRTSFALIQSIPINFMSMFNYANLLASTSLMCAIWKHFPISNTCKKFYKSRKGHQWTL